MIFDQHREDKRLWKIYVPFNSSKLIKSRISLCIIFNFVLTNLYLIDYAKTELINDAQYRHHKHHIEPTPIGYLDLRQDFSDEFINSRKWSDISVTPPIDTDRIIKDSFSFQGYANERNRRWISPQRVYEKLSPFEPNSELFSPIFGQNSEHNEHHNQQERDAELEQAPNAQADSSNSLMDLIEPGSGGDWDQPPAGEATPLREYSIYPNKVLPNPMTTPRFDSVSGASDSNDQAPLLARRLPVLVVTAGLQWHHTIPAETFEDEDGSLRKLQTFLEFKSSSIESDNIDNRENSHYTHWLQYDQQAQTLVGYPTTFDIGMHSYELIVSDRLGQTNNLTIDIIVRHHPSIRAFSHQFSLVNIEWDVEKYSSLTKALIDITKRITEGIYSDATSKNFILNSYHFPNMNDSKQLNNALSPMTLIWSNGSIPIYPCNSTQLDLILKNLVEEQFYLPNQTSINSGTSSFTPSQNLIRTLEPAFKLMKVEFTLLGSCRNAILGNQLNESEQVNNGDEPIIRTRIQRLQWRLGQPFIFQIPEDNFVSTDSGSANKTFDLMLFIHTIDGIPLEDDPQYNYMEFDQESRTLFGMPYDENLHTGQRELLLTVKSKNSDQDKVARDVMIIDIVAPELTVINNRAFNMSLYLMSRVNAFTPKMRVNLSQKIVQSLGIDHLNYAPATLGNVEFVAIEIKKFKLDSQLSTFIDQTNLWAYHDKIKRIDDTLSIEQKPDHLGHNGNSVLFKLTWTNESIGYKGDCPVEVITENVVGSLERNMFEYDSLDEKLDDPNKNDSVRFYERLRAYFEPEIDLIFLSIGPMEGSACSNALGYYDVGNSDLADLVNWADLSASTAALRDIVDLQATTYTSKSGASGDDYKSTRQMINSDEYWSIVVLIILVVGLIFVVMMFFMGMHTYRINQEKRFELQVKLAQARQNSMYLSSMMLADQMAQPNSFKLQQTIGGEPIQLNEDGSSRKPVILDSEKQLWSNGHTDMSVYKQPTAVQLIGQTVQTTSLRPNMTFTLDSLASLQNNMQTNVSVGSELVAPNQIFIDDTKRAMTLNRRSTATNSQKQPSIMSRQTSMNQLNHSQSILTVASLSGPVQLVPHQGVQNLPVMYAPLPIVCESNEIERT